MLAAAAAGRRTTASRCECGAPKSSGVALLRKLRTPVGEQASSPARSAVIRAADAGFCPSCGKRPSACQRDGRARADATVIRRPGSAPRKEAEADRWEE